VGVFAHLPKKVHFSNTPIPWQGAPLCSRRSDMQIGHACEQSTRLIMNFSFLTGWTACGTPALWHKSTPGTCRGPLDLRASDIGLWSNTRKPLSVASLAYPLGLILGKILRL